MLRGSGIAAGGPLKNRTLLHSPTVIRQRLLVVDSAGDDSVALFVEIRQRNSATFFPERDVGKRVAEVNLVLEDVNNAVWSRSAHHRI